jgi:hypothetical protein
MMFFSIVAGKISLYTRSRFLGYSPPFLKNLLVKGVSTPSSHVKGGGSKFGRPNVASRILTTIQSVTTTRIMKRNLG